MRHFILTYCLLFNVFLWLFGLSLEATTSTHLAAPSYFGENSQPPNLTEALKKLGTQYPIISLKEDEINSPATFAKIKDLLNKSQDTTFIFWFDIDNTLDRYTAEKFNALVQIIHDAGHEEGKDPIHFVGIATSRKLVGDTLKPDKDSKGNDEWTFARVEKQSVFDNTNFKSNINFVDHSKIDFIVGTHSFINPQINNAHGGLTLHWVAQICYKNEYFVFSQPNASLEDKSGFPRGTKKAALTALEEAYSKFKILAGKSPFLKATNGKKVCIFGLDDSPLNNASLLTGRNPPDPKDPIAQDISAMETLQKGFFGKIHPDVMGFYNKYASGRLPRFSFLGSNYSCLTVIPPIPHPEGWRITELDHPSLTDKGPFFKIPKFLHFAYETAILEQLEKYFGSPGEIPPSIPPAVIENDPNALPSHSAIKVIAEGA